MFERGQRIDDEDTFGDVFKKDLIEVTGMRACRKMRSLRIDPYPDAILRRGLQCKEPRETTDPVLEEAMMYTVVVGMELLGGLADIHDSLNGMVLEALERKVEVDRAFIWLCHSLGRRDERVMILEDWQWDAMEHMRDIGEAQGGIQGRLLEVEVRLTQLQAIVVGQSREIEMLGGVVTRQLELLGIHRELILELDAENRRRFERIERIQDLWGRTFRNPILIDLDPEERDADEVTLVN